MELQISEWVADLRLQAKAHSRVLGDFWPGRISPGAVNWHWPALSSFHDLWFFFGGGAADLVDDVFFLGSALAAFARPPSHRVCEIRARAVFW